MKAPIPRGPRRLRRRAKEDDVDALVEDADSSLLELIDQVLTKGVVIQGDLMLGVADVDLVYLRVSALLCAADRVLGGRTTPSRRSRRR